MAHEAQLVPARDSSGRDMRRIVILALAYFLAHEVALQFPDSQKILSAVWPAGGIGLAALLLSPRRRWPLILFTLFLAGNSANLIAGRPVLTSVGFMVANLAESLLCASLISYFCGSVVRFARTSEVWALIVSAVAVNGVTALLGAGAAALAGGAPYWAAWRTWWVSDGLGILLVAPLILAWSSDKDWFSSLRWHRALESVLFLAIWCAATMLTFQPYSAEHLWQPYMLFALLGWPVFRFGQRGVTAALVVAAMLAVTSKAVSVGPILWGGADPVARLLAVQLFLAFAGGTALVLAASYTESQSAGKAAQESLARLQLALAERNVAEAARQTGQSLLSAVADATSDAIYAKDLQGRYLLFNRASEKFVGKTAASVLGHDAFFIFPAAEAAEVMATDRTIIDRATAATYEEVLTSSDGRATTFLITKGPLVDAEGAPCGIYGVAREITDRKRAENELRREREMLARAEAIAHIGSWEWDVTTDTVTWSEELFRIFQRDPGEGAPRFAEHPALYHPDDMVRLRKAVEDAVADGTPYELELRAIRKDGSARVCAASGVAELGSDGRAVRLLGTLQDITDRKRAEQSLRESEQKFATIFRCSPAATTLTDIAGGFRFIEVSEAFESVVGYRRDEVIGRNGADLAIWVDPLEFAEATGRLGETGVLRDFEFRFRRKDGEIRLGSMSADVVEIDGRSYVIASTIDITERKRAEEALRRSEERFHSLFNASLDGIMVHHQGVILDANAAFARLFGYETPEELIGTSGLDFMMTSESAARIRQSMQQGVSGPIEVTAIRKDGSRFEAETDSHPMEYRGVQASIASCRDITERKRADQEARESSARLAVILEATSDGTWDWNIQSGDAVFSPRYSTMLGYDPEEFARNYKTWKNLVHPDDVDRVKQHHADHFAGRTDFSIEFRMREQSGNWHWIHSRGLLIERDGEGNPLRMVGTHSDIQQRKLAEEALRTSEERLRLILESSPVAVNITRGTDIVYANPSYLEMFGFRSLDELTGIAPLDLFVSEWRPRIQENIQRRAQGLPVPAQYEAECVRKDGTTFSVLQRLARVTFADGPATVAFIVDITERKRSEETLRRSEEQFQFAMEATSDGLWDWNIQTDGAYFSPGYYRMLGYEAGAFPGSGAAWMGLLHPDDRERAGEPLDCVEGRCDSFEMEFRMKSRSGGWRWILSRGKAVARDAQGRALRLVGTHVDITDRKQAESVQAFLAQTGNGAGEGHFFDALAKYLAESLQMDFVRIDRLLGSGLAAQTVSVWCDGQFQDNLTYTLKDTPCGDVVGKRVCCFPNEVRHLFPRDAVLQEMVAESYAGSTLWSFDGKPIGLIAVIGRRPMEDTRLVESVLEQVSVRAARELERMQAEATLRENEALLNQTGEIAKVGGWKIDLHTKQVTWTREVFRIHELDESFVPSVERAIDFYAPESWPVIKQAVERAIEHGEAFDLELEIVAARKQRRAIHTIGKLETRADGTRFLAGSFQDITERRCTEAALRENEERLRSIYNTVGDTIFQLAVEPEEQFRFVSVNPAFLKTTGLTSEMVVGRLVTEVVPEPALTMVLEKYQRAIRENTVVRWEETSVYPTGEMTGDVSVAPVFDQKGNCTHLVGSVHEITDRKRAEDALRESEERLRRAVLQSPFPLMLHAEDGEVLTISDAWTEITGYSHADIPTIADWTERAYGERKDLVRATVDRVYGLREKVNEGEYEIRTKSGEKRTWEFAAAPLGRLPDGRRLAISMAADITERKLAEEVLANKQAELSAIYAHAPVMMCLMDADQRILYSNPAFTAFTGPSDADGKAGRIGNELGCINALDDPRGCSFGANCGNCALRLAMLNTLKDGLDRHNVEHQMTVLRNGQRQKVALMGHLTLIPKAGGPQLLLCLTDVTERVLAEEEKDRLTVQLIQAQKMESVGRLAGGVAHDFNNLLTVINGYSGFLLNRLHAYDPLRPYAEHISQAGDRAASLTKQLLAFSRKQVINPRILDLNKTIVDAVPMLARMIGEDVAFQTKLDPSLGQVRADADQVYQVIMNLVVNARDAMPDGGELQIETSNVEVDVAGAAAIDPAAGSGRYVLMTVTDTGHGMDDATRGQIFEPFFTTKEVDKGTGLGLATVYGIVRQSAGWITVQSEVGVGTSFNIYFPRMEHSAPSAMKAVPAEAKKGGETILLVEDQDVVRSFAKDVLTAYGYAVIEASGGEQAIAVAKQHPGNIQLLVTDVVLPGMNGKTVFERLKALLPNLAAFYISGYPREIIAQRGVLDEGAQFLQKPFSPDALAAKVREVLDTPTDLN